MLYCSWWGQTIISKTSLMRRWVKKSFGAISVTMGRCPLPKISLQPVLWGLKSFNEDFAFSFRIRDKDDKSDTLERENWTPIALAHISVIALNYNLSVCLSAYPDKGCEFLEGNDHASLISDFSGFLPVPGRKQTAKKTVKEWINERENVYLP